MSEKVFRYFLFVLYLFLTVYIPIRIILMFSDFDFTQDNANFHWMMWFIQLFGLYLYPLHFFLINASTCKINDSLFVILETIAILIPTFWYYVFYTHDAYYIFGLLLINFLIKCIPFYIFYWIKKKINS